MSTTEPNPRAFEIFYKAGLEYYVSGRGSLLSGNGLTPGNLFHHAVEMLLKGQLSKTVSLKDLADPKKFYHDLLKLWPAFKNCFPAEDLTEFDAMVAALQKFEDIRYPDTILAKGASIGLGWGRGNPVTFGGKEPDYQIGVGDVDAMFARLFPLCGLNPKAYFSSLSPHGRQVLHEANSQSQNWLR